LLLSVALASGSVVAKESPDFSPESVVALSALPPQAKTTYQLILQGGPFPYEKDGSVFGNRERLLPLQTRGYYREYTVKTPGASNRGARRIVCGGRQITAPQACYYTADHYASFRKIVP
jgi:ribonuclease T1